jgi:malonyl-ACP decarboxylase
MKDSSLVSSGIGGTSAIGQGRSGFADALPEGRDRFGRLQCQGRRFHPPNDGEPADWIGVELAMPASIAASPLGTVSSSARLALAVLSETDPKRIGLIIGGSRVQRRRLLLNHAKYCERPRFSQPTLGMSFMDIDTLNLVDPIAPSFNRVGESTGAHDIEHALNMRIGFGGVNSAACLARAA